MNVERKNAKDDLRLYMPEVIGMLKREGKFPAMHVYACTLRSYEKFCAEERHPKNATASLSMQEIFTPERLKEYEDWLAGQQSSPNTISTYMRTLQAVYNRWMSPGIEGYNPVLFKDVYTKVESRTKRALTAEQMEQLRNTDFSVLTLRQQQVLTYFLLMFMLRGMPFIDLAHLRKSDLRNRRITYRRHKTGKLMVVDVPPDEAVAEVQGQDGFGVSVPVAAWWLVHGGTSPPLSRNITAFQPGVGAADETVIARCFRKFVHRTPYMGYTCLS